MARTLQGTAKARGTLAPAALRQGIWWGAAAGFAGTLVMDLVLMGALAAAGEPALACFSIVGNTVARLFLTAGGVSLGVATHYTVGPLFGALFGAVMAKAGALRVTTRTRCLLLAVLYVEVLSLPLLALTPILLKDAAPDMLLWFGGSFAMHFIWGVVFGVLLSCGLRSPQT